MALKNFRTLLLTAALVLALGASVQAGPLYSLRVDGSGVPLVLYGTQGYSGSQFGQLGGTIDGMVVATDGLSAGWEFHVLDPSLESANNSPSDSHAALVQVYNTSGDLYTASVSTGVKTSMSYMDGITRGMPGDGGFFWWAGGGTASVKDIRFEDGTGSYDSSSGSAADRADFSTNAGSGSYHKGSLELIGETGAGTDTWMVVGGQTTAGGGWGGAINRYVRKMQFGPLTGLDTVTPAAGSRSVSVGGILTDGSGSGQNLLSDLVPGISDSVWDMAYNPYDGNLYFQSVDGTNGRVYVSAISFDWAPGDDFTADSVATIVDLDPDSANTYLDVTYVAADNPNDLTGGDLTTSIGLTFSPDGSRMFISSGTSNNRVFQFDLNAAPVPEPATLGLLALGGLALAGRRFRRRA